MEDPVTKKIYLVLQNMENILKTSISHGDLLNLEASIMNYHNKEVDEDGEINIDLIKDRIESYRNEDLRSGIRFEEVLVGSLMEISKQLKERNEAIMNYHNKDV